MIGGNKAFNNLTLGQYTVIESNNTVENFEITTTYKVDGEEASSVTLADGDSKTVEVTNTVNKLEGSLTVTKTWTGDDSELTEDQKNAVTFTVTGPKQHSDDEEEFSAVFT